MSARELLAKGWEFTQQSMALAGLPVPDCIHFQINGRRQIRATRVAELDELAQAIAAIDEDIGRLVQGAPALNYNGSDIDRLRQEWRGCPPGRIMTARCRFDAPTPTRRVSKRFR
jgi:hypothetical protein